MDNLNRFHSAYTHIPRHWSSHSQHYAGGDALLTFLSDGWTIQGDIDCEEFWHGGARRVTIFYFVLARDNQSLTMRVHGNPFVDRLLRELHLHVMPATSARTPVLQAVQ